MEEFLSYSMTELVDSAKPAREGGRVDEIHRPEDGFKLSRTHYRLRDIHKFKGVDPLKKLLAAWYNPVFPR